MAETGVDILLVDDSERDLLALETVLERLDARFVRASSGHEALRCLLERDFAVILLDVQMPEMNGFETAALIREREKSRHTPIIFVTGVDATDESVSKGYALGAVDYIRKPIIAEILRSKVGVFIELAKKSAQVRQAEVQLRRQREQQERIQELEAALDRYRELSSTGTHTPITRDLAGGLPLKACAAEAFASLVQDYAGLVDVYLNHLIVKNRKPRKEMEALAGRLGDLGAGPRDLIDIHVNSMESLVGEANDERARVYAIEGRLFVLEIMGLLVDYYRFGLRRSPASGGGT
jgi:CheY-like chemotaxis protein